MADTVDMDLVREFVAGNSDSAFATLVKRHINLVYSVALRRLGDRQHAEDVTQAVFLILASKAGSLRPGTVLSGWLYQTARLTAINFQRAARRRQCREQEAQMQFMQDSQPDVSWQQLAPLLEEALARLGEQERDAVVLRFFDNRTVGEVAAALNLKESAAQMRVSRATEKMRKFFVRRGIPISTAVLMAAIGTNAVQAAPAALSSTVVGTVAVKGAIVGAPTLALTKSTLKLMAWAKLKTAAIIGAAAIVAAAATTIAVEKFSSPAAPAVLPDSDYMKAFKQFVESPLMIKSLRFRWQHVGTISYLDGRVEHFPMESFTEVRYQTNAIFVETVTNVNDFAQPNLGIRPALRLDGIAGYSAEFVQVAGWFDRTCWEMVNGSFVTDALSGEAYRSFGSPSQTPVIMQKSLRDAARVMNMGVPGDQIGKLRWSGNRVENIDFFGRHFTSVLELDSQGRPSGLDTLYPADPDSPRGSKSNITAHVDYEYDRSFRGWPLPTTIRINTNDVITILSVELATAPQSQAMFSPNPFLNRHSHLFQIVVRHDGKEISKKRYDEATDSIAEAAGIWMPPAKAQSARLIFTLGIVIGTAVLALGVAFIVHRWREKSNAG
jgi:RNA polymerase sigma factor (sigma-70 family)